MQRQAREGYERAVAGPNETRQKIPNMAPEEIPQLLTRSQAYHHFTEIGASLVTAVSFAGKPFLVILLPSPYILQSKILETIGSE